MDAIPRAAVAFALCAALIACEQPPAPASSSVARHDGLVDECEPPSSSGSTVQLLPSDVSRIRELPHYASGIIDFPAEEPLYASVTLRVEPNGNRVVSLGATDSTMRRTIAAWFDATSALEQRSQGEMLAHLGDGGGQQIGHIQISGVGEETPVFLRGPLVEADLQVQPDGFFVLQITTGQLVSWFPTDDPAAEQDAVAQFSEAEYRAVGRLLGSCLVASETGDPIRVMDVLADPRCAALMGHL